MSEVGTVGWEEDRAKRAEAERDELAGLFKDLFLDWREHDWQDIDGGDFQGLLLKHGFLEEAKITVEECKEDWAREWGYEPGDKFNRQTDFCKRIIA